MKRKIEIMYSIIDLPLKVQVESMKYRKRVHCFTQVLQTSISNVLAAKEIE
jgi:hypothetical protein